jgi:hypothetical protein
MNYTLNNTLDPDYKDLTQIWTNTYVLKTKNDGLFKFQYSDNMLNPISYKPIDKNIYVIKDESTLIDSNFDKCQINYY